MWKKHDTFRQFSGLFVPPKSLQLNGEPIRHYADFATAVCTVRTTYFPVNSVLWHHRTLSTYLADIKNKMLKVPKSPLPRREVTGELTSINSYLHVTTPQRASAHEAGQLQCCANPHIVTAHSASAKPVLVQHVY